LRGYASWLGDALTGDLGTSIRTDEPIRDLLLDRAPWTIALMVVGSVTCGAVAAVRQALHTRSRRAVELLTFVVAAVLPVVALSLAIVLPAKHWRYSHPVGLGSFRDDLGESFTLIIPVAVIVGALSAATAMITTRAEPGRSMLSSLAVLGAALPFMLSAAIIGELIFSIQGLQGLVFEATIVRDLYVLQALITLEVTLAISLAMFVPVPPQRVTSDRAPAHARQLVKKPLVLVCGVVLAVLAVCAIAGPWLVDDPGALNVSERNQAPSWNHPLGTTDLGADVLSILVAGSRSPVKFAAVIVFLGYLPGALTGTALRSRSMSLEPKARRAAAMVLGIPLLLVVVGSGDFMLDLRRAAAIACASAFAFGMSHVLSAASYGRVVPLRDSINATWVAAGACVVASGAIALETTLNFIGLGGSLFDGGWGSALRDGVAGFSNWWMIWSPVLFITTVLVALNGLALELREFGSASRGMPAQAASRPALTSPASAPTPPPTGRSPTPRSTPPARTAPPSSCHRPP
jgi:peptide/nickel transport system permease protein